MSSLRIKLGASVDASVSTAFTQLEKAAQRAAATIKKQLADAGVDATRRLALEASKGAGPYRQTGQAAEDAGKKIRKANQEAAASLGALSTGVKQKFNGLHNDLLKLPVDLRIVAQEAQKALVATERARARAALGLGSSSSGGAGGGGGAGRNSIYWHPASWLTVRKPNIRTIDIDPLGMAGRFGMGAGAFLGRAAMGMARASGVETDWTALGARNVNEERLAQQLSNSGYMPGQSGPNGQIVGRQTLLGESRQTAINTGMARGDILEGMQAFVGKTGDLNLARQSMEDLAKLSRATGTSFADMANASAEVANVLGDVPDKGKVVEGIMRQVAGQGKLGAVEVRDMATQMAKIATQASKFQGGAAENISILGTIAQEAKGRGGATNAAQATTAVARFADQLTQKTVLNKMSAHGLNVFADSGHTQLKQAPDVIKAILRYTHGDLGKLSDIMPSSIARKAIGGFAQVYNQAGGGDKGLAAVDAEFKRFAAQQLTTEEVNRSFAASMETSEAKAKQFNEQMSGVVEKTQGELLPALTALAPAVLAAAGAFGTFTSDTANALRGKADYKGEHADFRLAWDKPFWAQPPGVLGALWERMGRNDREMAGMDSAKASIAATNDQSTILGWMGGNLVENGETALSPEEIAKNKSTVAPMLAKLAEDDARLTLYAGDLSEKVTAEGKDLRGNMGSYGLTDSDEDIKKLAGMGGSAGAQATQYLQDKQQLVSLQDQQKKVEDLMATLRTVISSGAVTVRMADGGAPPTNNSGVAPANSDDLTSHP